MKKLILVTAIVILMAVCRAHGGWCWVEGTVKTPLDAPPTSRNKPCEDMVVWIIHNDDGQNVLLGEGICDADGKFGASVQISGFGWEKNNLFLIAAYQAWLPGSKRVNVTIDGATVMQQEYLYSTALGASYWPDYSADELYVGTVHLARSGAHLGTEPLILHRVVQTVWYVKTQCGWDIPEDIDVWADAYTDPADYGSAGAAGTTIYLGRFNYDEPGAGGGGWLSDINHETGHVIHDLVIGDQQTPGGTGSHWLTKETDPGQALTEGWAAYVAEITSAPTDDKCTIAGAVDDSNVESSIWWRGHADPPKPDNDGSDNSGIIVEGAIWLTWSAMNDFSGTFSALKNANNPPHFKAWLDRYCVETSAFPAKQAAFEIAQSNGILFSRAKLTGFREGPPTTTQPVAGNARIINDIQFVRGTVKVTKSALTAAELHIDVAPGLLEGPTNYIVCEKDAEAERNDFTTLRPDWWHYGAETDWWTDYQLDTTQLTTTESDHDLVISVQHSDGMWDTLEPHFSPLVEDPADSSEWNTDEKWLKHLRTWFDRNTGPEAGWSDNKSMIRVDNRAPTISDVKPAAN